MVGAAGTGAGPCSASAPDDNRRENAAATRLDPEPHTPDRLPAAAGERLEPLGGGHLEACLALDGLALGGLWSRSQWAGELEAPQRPRLGLWSGPELVAMACGWLILDELHITLVAVHPQCRRRGLGRRLLAALLAAARDAGAVHATLEVARANAAGRALYAAAGFREAGVRRGYYRNGDDALIQWLRLTP